MTILAESHNYTCQFENEKQSGGLNSINQLLVEQPQCTEPKTGIRYHVPPDSTCLNHYSRGKTLPTVLIKIGISRT